MNIKLKSVGKTVLILCACALVLFLLLPFLDSPAPVTGADKKATPQIFTSNPLTELATRIAALFGNKKAQARLEARRAAVAASPQAGYEELLAASSAANEDPARAAAESPRIFGGTGAGSQRFEYGEAAVQDEKGNWVLVRQTLPEGGAKGMHELSIKADPYESYVQQERHNRFTPAVRTQREVPTSKWVRLTAPVKKFFGFGADEVIPAGQGLASEGYALASSGGLGMGGNAAKQGSTFQTSSSDINVDLLPGNQTGGGAINLLSITDSLDAIDASIERDMDKAGLSEQEKKDQAKKRKEFREKKMQEFIQSRTNKIKEQAGDAGPQDLLKKTLSCAGPLYGLDAAKRNCPISLAVDIAKAQQENAAKLAKAFGSTKVNFKMLPVLGKADGFTPDQDPKAISNTKDLQAFYEFMYERQGCTRKECFWVANELQQQGKEDLRKSVTASGAEFAGDPLGKYQHLVGEFQKSEQFLRLFAEENEAGENRGTRMQRELGNTAPFYIPYTKEDLISSTQTKGGKKHGKEQSSTPPLLYVPMAANAADVITRVPVLAAQIVSGGDGRALQSDAESSKEPSTTNPNQPAATPGLVGLLKNKDAMPGGPGENASTGGPMDVIERGNLIADQSAGFFQELRDFINGYQKESVQQGVRGGFSSERIKNLREKAVSEQMNPGVARPKSTK